MGIFNLNNKNVHNNNSKEFLVNNLDENVEFNGTLLSDNSTMVIDDETNVIDLINFDNQNNDIPLFENSPLVSIIIINRNGETHLKRLLSVIDETIHLNYELIIVDNDSTDNSIELIKSFTKLPISLIQNNQNHSFSHANNQAVEISKGDYLLFLNNDIKPLDGWLNHLLNTMLSNENVGAVGSKLIYPNCESSTLNKDKSYTIQHSGIIFKEGNGYIKPFNRDNGVNYSDLTNKFTEEEIIAVTAACLLIKKSVYIEVGGFDEGYIYGYEDVDLCLKLYKKGYKNIYNPQSVLYHYEFGTQEKNDRKDVIERRLNNQNIFIKKWNKWLRKKLIDDKLKNEHIFSDKNFTVSFVVTQSDENTTAGDYFTALTLANQLKKFGWEIKYQSRISSDEENDWYVVDEDVDILISLLDAYDLSKVKCKNGLLVKIAWLRNWFERWLENPSFIKYDIILASSQKACDFIKEKTGMEALLYPLASDNTMFNAEIPEDKEYLCDYCFTGSYWDAKREIIDYLNPDSTDYLFNLYGVNWEKIPKLSNYYKGFVNYLDMPQVYSSCKIVIDDANHVTKEWASVNSRVFDTLSSGKLVITNGTDGNNELFGGQIPEYHSEEDLMGLIKYYMENPEKRAEKIKLLQKIVLDNHTYKHRADFLKKILQKYYKTPKVAIKVPVPSWDQIHQWGDYFVAEGLKKGFEKKGYSTKIQLLPEWNNSEDVLVDTVIVLRGLSYYEPKIQHFNIMWNISHPEAVSLLEYELYDYVFIAKKIWTNKIKKYVDKPVDCMFQCTDINRFYPDFNEKYESELLFVGNSRNEYRKIIKDLLPTEYDLSVYGAGWTGIIDSEYIKGENIPNNMLRQAYSSCKILLNDHWEDMRELGFISNRIFDAIACGSIVISDNVEGINELFPNRIFTYNTKEELDQIIEDNLNKSEKIINDVSGHTYEDRVKTFIKLIEENSKLNN